MNKAQKIIVIIIVLAIAAGGYFLFRPKKDNVKQINLTGNGEAQQKQSTGPANTGNVSPISGLACENWNKRAIAVMQPADVSARPAAGFSDADMVFEMPVFTNANNRLMGVYLCNIPKDIGSMRSARHDYIPLAAGLDAVFIHWGYSKFAESLLDKKIIDNIDCLTTSYCPRWPQTGIMKYEDTGHITSDSIMQAMQKYGYRTTGEFSGYPHQEETSPENRPSGGELRLAYPSVYDVNYNYDKETNSYARIWNGVKDTDKNNGKQVAPKNIVVMFAGDSQIKLADEQSYIDQGLMDPWTLVPEEERAGLDYGGVGRYNNLQIGDPWFDSSDSGDAYFYFNGQQIKGTWKKDKSKLNSKLTFYNSDGSEVKFVPGQIWINIMEPGQGMRWTPA